MTALADQMEQRAAGTELAKQDQEENVLQAIERQGPEIARALPLGMTQERFTRIVVTAVKQTPALQRCTKASLLGAVMLSAQLGLEPGPLGHAYFVPFGDQVTFIVGYKGLIDLAMRSGKIESIIARDVRENDVFDYELGTEETITHKPALSDRGQTIAYYAVARLVGGGKIMHVMSRDDIEQHRKRSRAKDSGPWRTDYDAMARKTVIRVMSPYLPMSIDAARAIANDDVVVESIAPDLADRTPDPNVIDVEGHEDDDPDDSGPRGAASPPGAGVSEAEKVDGAQSPSAGGNAHAPSTTANKRAGAVEANATSADEGHARPPATVPAPVAGGEADTASVSGASANPSVETVNDDGAQMVAMWCADNGVGDDLRPAFLYAFSDGAYHSAHEVPVEQLAVLRAALLRVKRGEWVLHVPAPGEGEPQLRVAGDHISTSLTDTPPGPAPASVTWRAVLGEYKGIGQAKLLRRARDLAAQAGVTLPTSLDDIDPTLNEPLRAWLDEQAAAA